MTPFVPRTVVVAALEPPLLCLRLTAVLVTAMVGACSYNPVSSAGGMAGPGDAAPPSEPRPVDPPAPRPGPDGSLASAPDVAWPADGPLDPAVDGPFNRPPVDTREAAPPPPPPDTGPPPPDPAPPPPPPPCLPPRPAAVFDATPAGTCGHACNVGSGLASDGAGAGLDCTGGGAVMIDGQPVTSCIGADFGAAIILDPVVIRMRSVASACGTGCSGTFCGTGRTALVFYGQERGVYEFAQDIPITPTFRDYLVTLRLAARYLLVCRTGGGAFREDVSVDSIASNAACQSAQ